MKSGWRIAVAVLVAAVVAPIALVAIVGYGSDRTTTGPLGIVGPEVPAGATVADIPADSLVAYQRAGAAFGLDWTVIAGVGKVETNHCRCTTPGCIPNTVNSAGARGCTQFIGTTWRRGLCDFCLEPRLSAPAPDGGGYATDGDGDGFADPWNKLDSSYSTARLLQATGAPADYPGSIFAYNHAHWYVAAVLAQAETYRRAALALSP